MTTQLKAVHTTAPNTNQNYPKPSVGSVVGGLFLGGVASNIANIPNKSINPKLIAVMQNFSNSLTQDELVQVSKGAEVAFSKTGLGKIGVEILRANESNVDEVGKIMAKELDNSPITKTLPKIMKEFVGKIFGDMAKDGENAFYAIQSKKIVLPEKGLELASFHEIGHALNGNSSIGKILQKTRYLQALIIPIALIALLKTKKQEGQEPKNALDKATTFIKDNAGKLAFAAFLPTLFEEALATFKGNGLAKKVLSSDLVQKVAKSNACGFASYFGMAATSAFAIFLATKVKDAITDASVKKKQAQTA